MPSLRTLRHRRGGAVAAPRPLLQRRSVLSTILVGGLLAMALVGVRAAHAASNDCGRTVDPAISAVHAFLGGSSGPMGCPTGNTTTVKARNGETALWNEYTGGFTVVRNTTQSAAAFIGGPIRTKWWNDGGFQGMWGLPTGHTTNLPVGQKQTFEFANYYSNPSIGTFAVPGDARNKYVALNEMNGPMGWPVSDLIPNGSGGSTLVLFQVGEAIAFNYTPNAYEQHVSYGDIFRFWAANGRESGSLGFPLTDELPAPSGNGDRYQEFEGGAVTWNHTTRGITRSPLPRLVARTWNVIVNDTSKVHPSNFRLVVRNDGFFQLTGHLYDSSSLYGDDVALGVQLGDTGHVLAMTGYMGVKSNRDVNISGFDPFIQANYATAAHANPSGKLKADGNFLKSLGGTLGSIFKWAWDNADKLIEIGGKLFAL